MMDGGNAGVAVSIHTPTKGVTTIFYLISQCFTCFNPHTHEGCDDYLAFRLAWRQGFNPHTHEGCDEVRDKAAAALKEFQSTHPRRV